MIDANRPVPGYYRRRLVRGGPWVAVHIYAVDAADPDTGEPMDRPTIYACTANGEPAKVFDHWPWVAMHAIDETEYRYMLGVKEWAIANDPTAPEANPKAPIRIDELPPIF